MRTQEELKKIAVDLFNGAIFCDRQVRNPNEITMVFPILTLLGEEGIKQIEDCGMIFEYMTEASPRAINGYPIFFSCVVLPKDETAVVFRYYNAIKKSVDDVQLVAEPPQNEENLI